MNNTIYTVTVTGNSIEDLHGNLSDLVPSPPEKSLDLFDKMGLEELLLYASKRCEEAGYEMEVKKPLAVAKKEEARAKLRGDLEASLKQEETKIEEPEPEVPAKKAAPKKTNGKAVSDADRKAQCIKVLQQLYANGRKTEVNKILADFGEGAKNFNVIPEDRFGPIHDAIEALPA
jgi:hypothetical protein